MTDPWLSHDREQQIAGIQATYDSYRNAGRYRLWDVSNRGIARQVRDRAAAIAALLRESIPAGGSLLDLGCGEGGLAAALIPQFPGITWTGIDVRPEAIAAAVDRVPGGHFFVASADRVPAPSESFDVVLAVVLFSSLPSPSFEAAVAAEIVRLLRPGGSIIWYDLRIANPQNRAVHGVDQRRLHELFPDFRAQVHTTTLLPPIARHLGVLTPVLYSALEAIPLFRSHLVGRLQRPVNR